MTLPSPSRRVRIECWAGRIAWVGLGMETVLWFVLSDVSIRNLLLMVVTSTVLILGTWLCTSALVFRYRRLFSTWYGLGGLAAALAMANWGRGIAPSGGITGLLLMGMLGLMAALPVSMILLLWRHDASVVLIGLVLLAFVWGSLLASVSHGIDGYRTAGRSGLSLASVPACSAGDPR
jgi:hypothetical protein